MLGVVVVTIWVWRDSQRGWTVEKLERLIREQVRPDADRQEVEAWFDRLGIPHSYSTETTDARYGDKTMPMLAGLNAEDLSGVVYAELHGPEANLGFLQTGRITIDYFFDKRGRLAGHLVFPFVYSL